MMLACQSIVGSSGSIELHTGIRDGTVREDRDLVEFLGSEDPDVISLMERSISGRIVKSFGKDGIVYDLSAVKYYGSGNDLAKYGHYYHSNGGNREINFVMAVTRTAGIPVHHRIMPGNIVSVSTVRNFATELSYYLMRGVMVVMDRGFYSRKNVDELKDFSVIGVIPSTLSLHWDLPVRSRRIENSRNYIQYGNETVFFMEHRIQPVRYIVYFSAKRRAEKIEVFYSRLWDMESDLRDLQHKEFENAQDMTKTVMSACGDMLKYVDIETAEKAFTYRLKHNAIHARTNRMGFFILFTNTILCAHEVLKIYRQKDMVEKAFMHSKSNMEPIYARKERGSRARMFLSVLTDAGKPMMKQWRYCQASKKSSTQTVYIPRWS